MEINRAAFEHWRSSASWQQAEAPTSRTGITRPNWCSRRRWPRSPPRCGHRNRKYHRDARGRGRACSAGYRAGIGTRACACNTPRTGAFASGGTRSAASQRARVRRLTTVATAARLRHRHTRRQTRRSIRPSHLHSSRSKTQTSSARRWCTNHRGRCSTVVVPADSVIGLQVETGVTTERAKLEDKVAARVTRDVKARSVAIPAGARAKVRSRWSSAAGEGSGAARHPVPYARAGRWHSPADQYRHDLPRGQVTGEKARRKSAAPRLVALSWARSSAARKAQSSAARLAQPAAALRSQRTERGHASGWLDCHRADGLARGRYCQTIKKRGRPTLFAPNLKHQSLKVSGANVPTTSFDVFERNDTIQRKLNRRRISGVAGLQSAEQTRQVGKCPARGVSGVAGNSVEDQLVGSVG